jgi:hypothetical protein
LVLAPVASAFSPSRGSSEIHSEISRIGIEISSSAGSRPTPVFLKYRDIPGTQVLVVLRPSHVRAARTTVHASALTTVP